MSLPHQNTKQGLASSLWNVEHVETEIDVHLFTSKNDISNCRYENNSKGCEKYLWIPLAWYVIDTTAAIPFKLHDVLPPAY